MVPFPMSRTSSWSVSRRPRLYWPTSASLKTSGMASDHSAATGMPWSLGGRIRIMQISAPTLKEFSIKKFDVFFHLSISLLLMITRLVSSCYSFLGSKDADKGGSVCGALGAGAPPGGFSGGRGVPFTDGVVVEL